MKLIDHEPTDKELGRIISLTRKILREAKSRGVEMSKRTAKRHALEAIGFVDSSIRVEVVEENRLAELFKDGAKTANPKYSKPV